MGTRFSVVFCFCVLVQCFWTFGLWIEKNVIIEIKWKEGVYMVKRSDGKSATELGEILGLSPRDINRLLEKNGLIEKYGDEWRLTEKGKEYGFEFGWDNGYGGYAHRGYSYILWYDDVLSLLRRI